MTAVLIIIHILQLRNLCINEKQFTQYAQLRAEMCTFGNQEGRLQSNKTNTTSLDAHYVKNNFFFHKIQDHTGRFLLEMIDSTHQEETNFTFQVHMLLLTTYNKSTKFTWQNVCLVLAWPGLHVSHTRHKLARAMTDWPASVLCSLCVQNLYVGCAPTLAERTGTTQPYPSCQPADQLTDWLDGTLRASSFTGWPSLTVFLFPHHSPSILLLSIYTRNDRTSVHQTVHISLTVHSLSSLLRWLLNK